MHDIHIELDVRQVLAITVGHQAIMDTVRRACPWSCHAIIHAAGTMTNPFVFFLFFFAGLIRGSHSEVTCSC